MAMEDRKRMLVVDDEPDMLDFIERVFRREYVVHRALSVDEALSILGAEKIDVLITDHRMPRLTGFELIQRAAEIQPAATRILLTGYAEASAAPAGAHAYITKPVDAETLQLQVADAVRSASS